MINIVRTTDVKNLIATLVSHIEKIANDSIALRGKFYVGLSGGSLVKYLVEGLPQIKTDFSKWVIAFCDERLVPEDSEDSTYGTYKRNLLHVIDLKPDNFIIVKQGVTAEEAAKDYTQKLTVALGSEDFRFDLLLLGMGPDGHTCSLFPGHPLTNEKVLKVAAITDSPKPPPERITLTFPVINNARNCIFAIGGKEKAEMLKRILVYKEDLPATRVKPVNGSLYWILDQAAATDIKEL